MQPTPPSPAVTLESLLTHAAWVRALARSLVADPASAEDIEQEVWRATLENPPHEGSNPRGWLASVARNAARSFGRARTRRERREGHAARPEALPPTSELVAEAELARELAGEVLALEEPYRTVLLLRFWRALTPEEIARAHSVSRETVRTQLKRGLARLRERLDRRFGDREQWLAALAPLAKEFPLALGSTTSAVGGGVLALAMKLGAAAALAATAWWAWPARVDHASELVREESTPIAPQARLETAEASAPSRAPADAVVAATSSQPAKAVAARRETIAGSVIDLEGKPVSGLELEWHPKRSSDWPHWEGTTLKLRRTGVDIPPAILELLRSNPAELEKLVAMFGDEPGFRDAVLGTPDERPSARTGLDGDFACSLGGGEWDLVLTDPHRTVVAEISSPRQPGWTLVVAPCVKVSGTVVDEGGEVIKGAAVYVDPDIGSLPHFPRASESLRPLRAFSGIGADGAFDLARAPLIQGHDIECDADGFKPRQVEVPALGSTSMRIVLARTSNDGKPRIEGLVLDAAGLPADGARVQLGQDGASTDQSGHFEFSLSIGHAGEPITATKRGFQAAVIENFGENELRSHSDVLLRLGPAALTISGRVLLADGTVPQQAHVQVTDGTGYGSTACFLEDVTEGHYMSGRLVPSSDGSFVLGGLSNRTYRLLAWDETLGQIAYSEPIQAGTSDVVLQARAESFLEELKGRVVTRRGQPIGDARVSISLPVFWDEGRGMSSSRVFGSVRTGADGEFTLRGVPRSWSRLAVDGEGLKNISLPIPTDGGSRLTIEAVLEVRTRLDVSDTAIDTVQFLDANDKVVDPVVHFPGVYSQQKYVQKKEGGFPVFTIRDDAVTAVLRSGTTVIRRVPIEIRREEHLTLRF